MTLVRQTKYSNAVQDFMRSAGHATNAEILTNLKTRFPDVTATTVHRTTARLLDRGQLASAPPAGGQAVRFDANLNPHDHFECLKCGNLRDITLPQNTLIALQKTLGDCQLTGQLNVQGVCACCLKEQKEKI